MTSVPEPEYGERPAAYIVIAPGELLDADTVRGHVRTRPARYAVPRDVHFRGRLPRDAMGEAVPCQRREAGTPGT